MEQKLNYIELINQFWTCHKEHCFSPSEIALYFHLLNTANSLAWKNPFREANMLICATLGISEPTLQRCRDRLVKAGLIAFKSGKVRRELTEYQILVLGTRLGINNLYLIDTLSSTQSSTQTVYQSDTQSVPEAFDFNKLNKTKLNIEEKENITKEKCNDPPQENKSDIELPVADEKPVLLSPEEMAFDDGRRLFPGTKRGLMTEYANFKKKHRDWKEAAFRIKPAVEKEIEHKKHLRARGQFVPEWKNFQTWINQRCWEQEFFELMNGVTNGERDKEYRVPAWFTGAK